MTTILVTGGTGALGRPTVDHLAATGHQVRVLSRRASAGRPAGPEWVTGDLTTGVGLPAAVDGVDTVVHLATSLGRRDVQHARNLLAVAPSDDTPRADVDRRHRPYPDGVLPHQTRGRAPRRRLRAPYTIQRATQFHNLLDRIFTAQRFLPALLAPAVTLQPIAVEDVAVRLDRTGRRTTGRQAGPPTSAGRSQRPAPDLARAWSSARTTGSAPVVRRRVVPIRVPGKAFRAFASGRRSRRRPAVRSDHLRGLPRSEVMKTYVRTVLVIFAAYELILGLWLTFVPKTFYDHVPTVDWTPPYSDHLFHDFGGATLGLGIVLGGRGSERIFYFPG